ncbi:MAG TPA: Rieske 2Fe-2S domain-containing protein [Longimicrobiales bacterium]
MKCQSCAGPSREEMHEALAGAVGMDRRELLKKGGLAAAALLLAACGGAGGSDLTGPSLGGSFTVKVSAYPALANAGGVAQVTSPGGLPVYVENTGSGYIALSAVCPHQGGFIQAFSNGFQCQVHGATFNKQGSWIGGQPTSNMRSFSVKSDASGDLTIG